MGTFLSVAYVKDPKDTKKSPERYFSNTLNVIKCDLKHNDPVIALLSWDSIHYINVVGVSAQNDGAVLDTDNSLGYYRMNDFEYQMDVISYSFISDNYVLIRFASNRKKYE